MRSDALDMMTSHGAAMLGSSQCACAGRQCRLVGGEATKLALRLCGPWPGDAVPDREAFFRARLDAAIDARAGLLGPEGGARLVHGEADWLPGLIVDRYADVLVMQVTTAFVERSLDAIVPHLVTRLGAAGPEPIGEE